MPMPADAYVHPALGAALSAPPHHISPLPWFLPRGNFDTEGRKGENARVVIEVVHGKATEGRHEPERADGLDNRRKRAVSRAGAGRVTIGPPPEGIEGKARRGCHSVFLLEVSSIHPFRLSLQDPESTSSGLASLVVELEVCNVTFGAEDEVGEFESNG